MSAFKNAFKNGAGAATGVIVAIVLLILLCSGVFVGCVAVMSSTPPQ